MTQKDWGIFAVILLVIALTAILAGMCELWEMLGYD
jgi:hypothetical protein